MHLAYLHYLCDGSTGLNHVAQFTDAARALGHRVDVHAMNPDPYELAGGEASLGARLRDALKRRAARYLHEPKELLYNARYLPRELEVLRAARPDVVLARDSMLICASVVVAARRLGLPLVFELNAPAVESRLFFSEYAHLPLLPEWIEAWKLRRADAVVVVSTASKRLVVERYGLPPEKIFVAKNGAAVDVFRPDAPRDDALPPGFTDGPVVGFVGSFQQWHGSDLLGELAVEVCRARPDVRFLVVGDGAGAPAARAATAALGDRVHFTGMVPHERVPGLVASLDVGVMPESNVYCSPLKVLEWMGAGKAVVAPRYEPLEETIDDGVDGLLFPPRDVRAMADAVIRLVDDADLRARIGSAAAARVRATSTWADNAQKVLAACSYAIGRRGGGRAAAVPATEGSG